ncbi:MAG TPA: GNAT family N-acetyltransferase [Phenylobacterium sp.]|nr:GNAT family N-acetyltransferase [Phenylobacterium sp.]HQN50030.1 GNAT family N-acetyltransferase [Phenylobacterium sp.]HQP18996.1 GNAT family N-acetyltransferase [Phenylobacterium sp.]
MPLYPAADADLDPIAALVNSAYRGDSSRAGWTTEADYLDGQRTDPETLRRDLAANSCARVLMLKDGPSEPLLGCVWLEPAKGDTWYLGMLTVTPTLQDRQLGRTMLAAAEAYVVEQGGKRIQMTVVSIRDTLIAWYERRGYAFTGETRPFPYEDEQFGVPRRADLSFIVMEKALV